MNRCVTTMLTIAFALPLTAALACASDVEDNLAAPLQSFGPLLGKTWKGEFKDSTPEKPIIDIARWERALNGQAIRVVHSINNGISSDFSLRGIGRVACSKTGWRKNNAEPRAAAVGEGMSAFPGPWLKHPPPPLSLVFCSASLAQHRPWTLFGYHPQ
jgi:hypothetical protein